MRNYRSSFAILIMIFWSCNDAKKSNTQNKSTDLTQEQEEQLAAQNSNEERELFYEHCPVPEALYAHIGGKEALVDNSSLSNEWSAQPGMEEITCPTFLIGDFTNNGKQDFVGLIQKPNTKEIYLLAVRDFEGDAKVDTLQNPIIGAEGEIETAVVPAEKAQEFQVYNFGQNVVKYSWNTSEWEKEEMALPDEYPMYD